MVTTLEKAPTKEKPRRVKEVVDGSQVAHLWAHQAQATAREPGKCCGNQSRFFFEGDTIYSYGRHFPIARHVTNRKGEKAVLITTRGYSKTTNGHIWAVRGAIRHLENVFDVERPDRDFTSKSGKLSVREEIAKHAVKYTELLELASKSRTKTGEYLGRAARLAQDTAAFAKFFGVPFPAKQFTAPEDLKGHFKALAEKQAKAAKAATEKREQERAAYIQTLRAILPEWLGGATEFYRKVNGRAQAYSPQFSELGRAYFRPIPGTDEVMTTLGARFPADHGKRAYRLLKRLRDAGQSYHANGHTIHVGAFQIDSYDHATGIIKAGCHTVDWSEVERLAGVMGWTMEGAE